MDAIDTGLLIAQARKEKGLTQKDLAQALHVTVQAVSKWERGLNFPDIALLEPLAEALDLTVSELLAGERGTLPQEEQVRDSLRMGLNQLGGKIKKWRKLFFALLALMMVPALVGGYRYVRDNTQLLPQQETIITPRENTDSETMAAQLGGMSLAFFDLTLGDSVTHCSVELELWTHEGLIQTWTMLPPNLRYDDYRHQTVALGYDVVMGDYEKQMPSSMDFGISIFSSVYEGSCTDLPYLFSGYGANTLSKPTVVSSEHGVVLVCMSADENGQGRWRVPGWLGDVDAPNVEEGEAFFLLRLRCE